ncbi:MAG: acetylornithine aminotransferase [Deltaproteobacteria bacterium RBG_13_52_11]|nr:MAG: acetylornithine aminotransferase [Deltaproteobacteria bacterium RBG_13_52_11]
MVLGGEALMREGQHVLANTYARYPILLVRGKGVKVWDSNGREYLDFVGGLAVCNLGHCHPKVVQALEEQARQLIHCSNFYYIGPQVELARRLCELSFGERVFFCNSGTEATEAAIKLARKYSTERYGPERYQIITMENSFHGRTMGALSATGQKKFHKGFEPLLPGFTYCPFDDLEAVAGAIGPQTCAVMVEPIQAEGGVNLPSPDYLKKLRELCDQTGTLLIYDEVQVGMGRTGKLFSYEHYDTPPHIMTLAKSLANGVPIGALVATDEVAQAFSPGDHASTFGGNPLATAVGCCVVDTLVGDGILENCQEMGGYLLKGLLGLKERYTFIKDVRGKGLIVGCELEFEGKKIVERCMDKGVLINCTADRVLRFLPPLIVTREEIDLLLKALDEVFSKR